MDNSTVKKMLEERLASLELRLGKIKLDASQSHSSDFEEQAQERENDEVLDQIGNETLASIQQIKTALAKIDNGSYGTCGSCGNDIGQNRLEIIPESDLCLECAA